MDLLGGSCHRLRRRDGRLTNRAPCNVGQNGRRPPRSRAHRAAPRCPHRSRAAGAHGGRGPPRLCGALDAVRRHRQGQPGHPCRHVRAVRARARVGAGLPQAPAAHNGDRAGLVLRLSHHRLGLLPARDGECRPCVVDCLAARRALSRRRQARGGARPAHVGAVLQFPRAQVQREYGADAGVGGDDAVVPALVRDPPPARRGARRGGRGGGHVRQILVGVPAAGARHRGARRRQARGLFPLACALGDDRGRERWRSLPMRLG